MGDKKNDRRFSLKELFGVMTWVAVAFALVRIGNVYDPGWQVVGVYMIITGVFCIAGFAFGGRELFIGIVLGMFVLFVVTLFILFTTTTF